MKIFLTCGILECSINVCLTWRLAIKMATTSIEIDTVIRGYHVYKETWTAMLGEVLLLQVRNGQFSLSVCCCGNERKYCLFILK